MAKAVTLKNQNNEEVYPVTSADLVNGEFSTSQIGTDAITDDKIDWSTVGDSDWIDISSSNDWTVKCRKSGNVVCVIGNAVAGSVQNYTTVGALPEGYRPSMSIYTIYTSKGGYHANTMRIESDGNIQLYADTAISYWGFCVTFIV